MRECRGGIGRTGVSEIRGYFMVKPDFRNVDRGIEALKRMIEASEAADAKKQREPLIKREREPGEDDQ